MRFRWRDTELQNRTLCPQQTWPPGVQALRTAHASHMTRHKDPEEEERLLVAAAEGDLFFLHKHCELGFIAKRRDLWGSLRVGEECQAGFVNPIIHGIYIHTVVVV